MRPENHAVLAKSSLPGHVKRQLTEHLESRQFHRTVVSSEKMTEIAEKAVAEAEAQWAAHLADPKTVAQAALDAAFYGSRKERENGRPGHNKDGWRDGQSSPFTIGGKVYDVIKVKDEDLIRTPEETDEAYELRCARTHGAATEATRRQYAVLSAGIAAGSVTQS